MKIIRYSIPSFGIALMIVSSAIMYQNPLADISTDRQKESINFNSNFLKYMAFGNQRLYSSALWIHTLLTGDLAHYENEDYSSWMFLRFRTISELDPKFYENYLYGGQYLSIIKDDLTGADYIYEKGLKVYPNDFWLKSNLAFNAYFEMQDYKKGINAYQELLSHPKLEEYYPRLPSLVSRMIASQGDLKTAFQIMYPKWKKAPKKTYLKEKYEKSLYAIKAEIDLECLNNGEKNCHQNDFYGRPYVKEGDVFRAEREWTKFRIKEKKRRGN